MDETMLGGRYRRVRPLGRGAMGEVWLAEDTLLHRRVAVKSVSSAIPAGPADLNRVLREARLAAQLNHPHAVAVYDVVVVDERPFVVMEYVSGQSLAELIAVSRLEAPEVGRIGIAVAQALGEAHHIGLVHRDVKPANIMITERGAPKIADFGIARLAADAERSTTGLTIGTPAFLAPELALGGTADPRSDIWALGVTVYAALDNGRSPFQREGDNAFTVIARLQHAPTVPGPARGGALTPTVMAMLANDPARRPSADEVVEMLRSDLAAGRETRQWSLPPFALAPPAIPTVPPDRREPSGPPRPAPRQPAPYTADTDRLPPTPQTPPPVPPPVPPPGPPPGPPVHLPAAYLTPPQRDDVDLVPFDDLYASAGAGAYRSDPFRSDPYGSAGGVAATGAVPGPGSRRGVLLAIVLAAVLVAGGITAVVLLTRKDDSAAPPTSGGSSSHTSSTTPSSSGSPGSTTATGTPTGTGTEYAFSGVVVFGPPGWRLDTSSGIKLTRDYVAPGHATYTTGTYFRIGTGNAHPLPSIAAELAMTVKYISTQSPYTGVTIISSATGTFLGVDSADIEYTGTFRGLTRHAILRIWISGGVTHEIVLNARSEEWATYRPVFDQLVAKARTQ